MSDQKGYDQRNHRIVDMLRAELNDLILRDLKDPRVDMASVTQIDLAGDLSQAKVYVSVLGDDPNRRQDCIAGLANASGYLRRELSHRLKLRTVPKLLFALDRGAEHSQMISAMLDDLPIPADDAPELSTDEGSENKSPSE